MRQYDNTQYIDSVAVAYGRTTLGYCERFGQPNAIPVPPTLSLCWTLSTVHTVATAAPESERGGGGGEYSKSLYHHEDSSLS